MELCNWTLFTSVHPVIIQIAINEPRKHLFSLGLEDTLIIFATHFNLERQNLVPSDVFAAVMYCVCIEPRTKCIVGKISNSTSKKYFLAPYNMISTADI